MATYLDNYGDLKEQVEEWAFNNNPSFQAKIPMFIRMAERDIARVFRMPAMEQEVRLKVYDGVVFIPPDLIELKSLRKKNGETIPQVSFETLREKRKSGLKDVCFARHRNAYEFYPTPENEVLDAQGNVVTPAEEVIVEYYRDVPVMQDDADKNVFLHLAPELLLYRSLQHAAAFNKDEEGALQFKALADEAAIILDTQLNEAEFSNVPVVMPNRGSF